MSIESQLEAWAKKPSSQKLIAKAIMQKYRGSAAAGGGGTMPVGVQSLTVARNRVNKILDTLYQSFPSALRSGSSTQNPIPRSVFIVTAPTKVQDGYYRFEISLDPTMIRRPSLYEAKYPDGLDNVIQYFSTGSKPSKNPVYGRVNVNSGKPDGSHKSQRVYIPKGYHREANSFLRDAVDKCNKEFAKQNIMITLDARYYP